MKDFSTVFRYELRTQLLKKTAIVSTVIISIIVLLLTFLPRIIALFNQPDAQVPQSAYHETGFVFEDEATRQLLQPLLGEDYRHYDSREDLVSAIASQEAEMGYVVTRDLGYEALYLDRSLYDQRDLQFAQALSGIKKEQLILSHGLSNADFIAIENTRAEGVTTVLGQNSENSYWISYFLMILVYMIVLMYGNGVSSIIAREKDSRTMEILITSTRPSSLILGKVAAAGVSAIVQFGFIILMAFIGFQINKSTYPAELLAMLSGTLTPTYLWSFLFFTLTGFILYLFIYAALGSTVSKMEDLGSATALVQFLFIFAYILSIFSAQMPDSTAAVIGSFIPFTSIMVMPLRAGMVSVPFYQYLVSGALMLAFVAFFAFLSIKIYRWGSLNYGNKTKLSRIVKEALRREHRA